MNFNETSVINFTESTGDGEYSGIITNGINSSGPLTQNKVYYVTTGGVWDAADSATNEDHASHMLGLSVGTNPVTNGMLLKGFFASEGHGFTKGAPLYLSTNGTYTNSVPGSGWARIIGYATSDDAIYFDPSKTYVEIA
jgi:hypothetical protein